MILLHTLFSLALAAMLVPALSFVVRGIAEDAGATEARLALSLALERGWPPELSGDRGLGAFDALEDVDFASGVAAAVGVSPDVAEAAREVPGAVLIQRMEGGRAMAVVWSEAGREFRVASAGSAVAGEAAFRMQLLVGVALIGVYALIALTLELFVLPGQVYRPIERLRSADEAVQRGERARELIPEAEMPRDELGDLMRSRNLSILKLRRQEQELSAALTRVESVAAELKEKNDLIERARRNMEDQERLASLGMMSAGIAHELNTPLSVLKGTLERVSSEVSAGGSRDRIDLMSRMVTRLERLSESLLDFARLREPATEPVDLREVVDRAWELVRIDRSASGVALINRVGCAEGSADRADGEGRSAARGWTCGDADRLGQVFVNLLRNAVDAMGGRGVVRVRSEVVEREGRRWIAVTVRDTGPGIDAGVFERLFEPFASTQLDAKGTGLGLAVSEGIVREHGGVITARNVEADAGSREPEGFEAGAVFEVLLPVRDDQLCGAAGAPAGGVS